MANTVLFPAASTLNTPISDTATYTHINMPAYTGYNYLVGYESAHWAAASTGDQATTHDVATLSTVEADLMQQHLHLTRGGVDHHHDSVIG
jgi:hypothetical protein